MYNEKKILAIIPARGGSKSIHKKNIQKILNSPLIYHTLKQASLSKYIDDIVVSSDCDEILQVAKESKISHISSKRPLEYAQDDSLVKDVMKYTLKTLSLKYDAVMLLEVTSPLRESGLIDKTIEAIFDSNSDSLATFTKLYTPAIKLWKIEDNKLDTFLPDVNPWMPRQMNSKKDEVYELNGLIYITLTDAFLDSTGSSLLSGSIYPYIVDGDFVDINELGDLELAEFYLRKEKYDKFEELI